MKEFTVNPTQQVRLRANPKLDDGSPSSIDPANPLHGDLLSGNGVSAAGADNGECIVAANEPGDITFSVKGDADMGAGVTEIEEIVVLHCSPVSATNLDLGGTVEPRTI